MKSSIKIASSLLVNTALVFIALYLLKYLLLPGLLCTLFISFFKRKLGNGILNVSQYLRTVAVSIDQLGNVVCKDLFDLTLIKKEGYLFGNPDETISGVLGKNQLKNTLSGVGKILNKILNSIEEDHSIKSIEVEESN